MTSTLTAKARTVFQQIIDLYRCVKLCVVLDCYEHSRLHVFTDSIHLHLSVWRLLQFNTVAVDFLDDIAVQDTEVRL